LTGTYEENASCISNQVGIKAIYLVPSVTALQHHLHSSKQTHPFKSSSTKQSKMHFSTPILSAILAFATSTTALGINCRGSSNCGGSGDVGLSDIINKANGAGDHHVFGNGEHVACLQFDNDGRLPGGSLCAFPQGTANGIEGWKAKQLLGFIRDHGCSRCGSVPVNFPNDNNVDSAGQLTVNWVQ
jgi:hypothetical protein